MKAEYLKLLHGEELECVLRYAKVNSVSEIDDDMFEKVYHDLNNDVAMIEYIITVLDSAIAKDKKPIMKVRCIKGSEQDDSLTVGKEYYVIEEIDETFYRMVDDSDDVYHWDKSHFEIIDTY